MRKGSPQDYTAEIGCYEQSTQKSRLGEPHECYPLYRIGRTQENHQLLHKDRRRPDCAGRHARSRTYGAAALGERPAATLAWSHGSHAVQRLDLRHPEALRPAALYGPPGQDEGHHRREEEKRSHRCTHDCRLGALRPVAQVLCATARVTRSATFTTLPQYGGATIGAHAEQDGGSADGERDRIQQGETAREEVLRRPHQELAGSTGVGQRPAAHESRGYGNVRVYAETAHPKTAFRAAQCLAADHADRSRQAGAALESAAGGALCSAAQARPPQSRYFASGAKTCGLSVGCRQERSALSVTYSAHATDHGQDQKEKGRFGQSCLPANLRRVRDHALPVGAMRTEMAGGSFLGMPIFP